MRGVFLLGTVIVSGVIYHLAQRTAGTTSPWAMLSVAYGVAFAATLVLAGADGASWPGRQASLAGLLIGLSAFGIEAGFFFIYRAGWPLASASVIASISATAILAVIGVIVFGESMSMLRVTGLALAAGAATLIAWG